MANYVEMGSLNLMTKFDQAKKTTQIGFKNVQLLTTETPGNGSYGYVCLARCDSLTCAAKILSSKLFEAKTQQRKGDSESIYENVSLTSRKLKEHCEVLTSIKHPNIVQYLGVHEDAEHGIALLMEQMGDNLTHFLGHMPNPLPYYTEVNFCSDITQALLFLHMNGIVHGNLTSNNVLLVGNFRLKVTDFGMATFMNVDQPLSFTPSPSTQVFLSPEALSENPILSEKGDCFSFGVLVIQILTKKYPKPSSTQQPVQATDPQVTTIANEEAVPEIKRRQDHISEIKQSHRLLQVALDCLKDESKERPSALDLCNRLSVLKQTPIYNESVAKYKNTQQCFATHDPSVTEKAVKVKMYELNQQHTREMREIKTALASSRETVRILCPGYTQQALEWTTKWEIDRSQITLLERINVGKFGDSVVYRGIWNEVIQVAVKTSMCDPIRGSMYLHEASIMKKFCHPKLIRLLGVCTKGESIFVVTKFMSNGNLLYYLKARDVRLQERILIQMAAQIADGMAYLECRKYIHRAVCAKSILLDDRLNCKVSNFHHAQELCSVTDSIELPSNDHLPVRWTAPETILQNKFCIKSDVWAFGILLYELMTRGEIPYIGIESGKVFPRVLSGYRIPHSAISSCPKKLYITMLDCWNEVPSNRPTFETLQWMLDEFYIN